MPPLRSRRLLFCEAVLLPIDLKIGAFTHADAGQMHLYLNYAREHWVREGENPLVGLILCSERDEALARYALDGLPNNVMAGEYRVTLPDEELLAGELDRTRQAMELRSPHPGEAQRLSAANEMTVCLRAIETQDEVNNMTERHGARLNLLGDPSDRNKVVYVAQTIKGGTEHNAPYHIQRRENGKAIEAFIDYEDDTALLKAIRDALNGNL